MQDLVVIGGGITGLSVAYEGVKKGYEVLLLEKSPFLGGEISSIKIDNFYIEKFYHHIFKSDNDIILLFDELGIKNHLKWYKSSVAYLFNEKLYPFSKFLDLIKLPIISVQDKIRLVLWTAYLQKSNNFDYFNETTIYKWLSGRFGKNAYSLLWEPLLKSKFGEYHKDLSMAWFWSKIKTRGTSRKFPWSGEELGYIKGGFKVFIDALIKKIKADGEIESSTEVKRIIKENNFFIVLTDKKEIKAKKIVLTIPPPLVCNLYDDMPDNYKNRLNIPYRSVLCLLLILSQQAFPYYWINVLDSSPYVGIIEHTNLIPKELYNNNSIIYLTRYLSDKDPIYNLHEDVLKDKFLTSFPYRDLVKRSYLFRSDYAQYIFRVGYINLSFNTPVDNLYLVSKAQIYPEDRGLNYSIKLAKDFIRII